MSLRNSNRVAFIYLLWFGGAFAVWVAFSSIAPALTLLPSAELKWINALYEKKRTRANALPAGSIFIVGGSNALFGVSSEILERASGMSTANFGTHAELHLSYHLHNVDRFMKRGDVVVLVLEYLYFRPSHDYTTTSIDMAMIYDLEYVFSRDLDVLVRHVFGFRIFQNVIDTIKNALGVVPRGVYSVKTLDFRGDETVNTIANQDAENRRMVKSYGPIMPFDPALGPAKLILETFVQTAKERGVTVFAGWPNLIEQSSYSNPEYTEFFSRMEAFFENIGIATVGKPSDDLMPSEQMYDSEYYPLAEGRDRRSRRLAKNLCKVINCRPG